MFTISLLNLSISKLTVPHWLAEVCLWSTGLGLLSSANHPSQRNAAVPNKRVGSWLWSAFSVLTLAVWGHHLFNLFTYILTTHLLRTWDCISVVSEMSPLIVQRYFGRVGPNCCSSGVCFLSLYHLQGGWKESSLHIGSNTAKAGCESTQHRREILISQCLCWKAGSSPPASEICFLVGVELI